MKIDWPRELGSLNYRQITWLACLLILGVVEGVAGIRKDPLLTEAMRAGLARWLLWTFILGIFLGHFIGERFLPAWTAWLLVPIGLALVYRDLFIRTSVPLLAQLESFVLFFALGAILFGKATP